jgi:3',5'-cyclic AMP phosphodiesterase CpdA
VSECGGGDRQPRLPSCRLPPIRADVWARDSILRLQAADRTQLVLVAVDSSKPDLDEGEIGRAHYAWIEEGFGKQADLRVFVCHHHLMPIPGTGRERNQVLDAGDVLALLRQAEVDVVLSGHRHVPYVWPVAGMLLIHSATASTLRTRAFTQPAYNLIRADANRISVELRIPGGDGQNLGSYPRDWPSELSARSPDPLAHPSPGPGLANNCVGFSIQTAFVNRRASRARSDEVAG